MSNYHIIAFAGLDLAQTGMKSVRGGTGDKKARIDILHPPYNPPISPYGTNAAAWEWKEFDAEYLLHGTPAENLAIMDDIRDRIGNYGVMVGKAGLVTKTRNGYLIDVEGEWEAPFMDGYYQWLYVTLTFQPMDEWA